MNLKVLEEVATYVPVKDENLPTDSEGETGIFFDISNGEVEISVISGDESQD